MKSKTCSATNTWSLLRTDEMKTHHKVGQDVKSILNRIGDYFAALYATVVGKFTAKETIDIIVCKLTVKAIIEFVKELRAKGAVKTLVADVNPVIAGCANAKSIKELEKLKNQGVTHIIAGVDKDGNLVDDVKLIHNEDEKTADEVVELLGDEGMVVIEG